MFEEKQQKYIESGKRVLQQELEGIRSLMNESLNESFVEAVDTILNTKGTVIVSGVGKSGHIGLKFASSMASTGTPSFFVHPNESSHGDMGMVRKGDCAILISNSGGAREMHDIIRYCKRFEIPIIGIARKRDSMLIEASDIKCVLENIPECADVKTPTTSTTMTLAYCDAITVALLEAKGFDNEAYKIFHPGGKLGAALIKVEELMSTGQDIPLVDENDDVYSVLQEMTVKHLGCTGVLDSKKNLVGIITDGDLRRHLTPEFFGKTAKDIMTKGPVAINKNMFAVEATALMNKKGLDNKGITSVFVVNEDLHDNPQEVSAIGILHINQCIKAGIV